MLLNGCSSTWGSFYLKNKAWSSKSYVQSSCFFAQFPSPAIRIARGSSQEQKLWSSRGNLSLKFSAPLTPNLSGNLHCLFRSTSLVPARRKPLLLPTPMEAAKGNVPTSFRFPAMTEKPKWWWRILACLPYLIPLHETLTCAETAYHLHPFLETLEFLMIPFLQALARVPVWLPTAYFIFAFPGIVKRKEWPHFLRFHVMMGMLMGIVMSVLSHVSKWMPLAVYWGKFGMHFWTAVTFAYFFTVLECIRCALCGMYADVPFVCDAAYMNIPYD